MKLIFEIRRHGDEDQAQHVAFKKFPVTVGRGFDNDIIVNDPYVDAAHLQVDYDGDTCRLTDLGSENGFTINGQDRGRSATIRPGDKLQLGHTEIHLYTPGFGVPPAIPQQKHAPLLAWLAKPFTVWLCFILTLCITLGWGYLEIWSDEIGLTLAGVAAATLALLMLWSAVWSVAGRLARHRAHFKSHVGLMCLYMMAGTVAWYVEVYIDFLTNENWFSTVASYGVNFILLALLIYGELTLATRMPPRRRRLSSIFFSAGVVAGVFAFTLISTKAFNQQPLYPYTLEPYLSSLAPAKTVDNFMKGNEALFASDEFEPPPTLAEAGTPKK